ncbi:unknown similar to AMEV200 [Choristoneura biennis entomopoxvirus]|uniref:Uncharacterized protein n=1 Tax=Choristoneura biennis entomopoxvirus TaxID=10288 RepID=A0A916P1F2_CBEPV|nr:unknown similar to AMEV200 [Choristoneura biennis entomopoxvirus]CCU55799.1 unknown similar to AMEV200 [Choristoneura biennis entomopoxvirus]
MSDITIYQSANIVDSFFNDILNDSLEKNNKYIIFIDWKNTMVTYNDGYILLRNNNGYIFNSYNNIIKNDNCKGFYIINNSLNDPVDLHDYMESINIDTTFIMDLNKIDPKIMDIENNIYNINYNYILTPKSEYIRYHRLVDLFLDDNYININPLIRNKLSIYIITSSICNIIDILLFSTNQYHIIFFQTYEDEKLFIKKYGKSRHSNNAIYCGVIKNISDNIITAWK